MWHAVVDEVIPADYSVCPLTTVNTIRNDVSIVSNTFNSSKLLTNVFNLNSLLFCIVCTYLQTLAANFGTYRAYALSDVGGAGGQKTRKITPLSARLISVRKLRENLDNAHR